MTGYTEQWGRALLLTLAVEMPLYLWLLRRRRFSARAALGSAFAANGISHPFLWFCFPPFLPYPLFLLAGEGTVIVIETAVLCVAARWTKADQRVIPLLVVAAVVNTVSTMAGLAAA